MEPAGSGATWTGSSKGVFAGRKHHKPRLALNNNTAGVCDGKDANRTRLAGHLDEIQDVMARLVAFTPSGILIALPPSAAPAPIEGPGAFVSGAPPFASGNQRHQRWSLEAQALSAPT
jgi:hypothetical protein